MSEDVRNLYRDVVLDHARRPRNRRRIEGARSAKGDNPLCGDRVTVYAEVDGDAVRDVAFEGAGCAISMASASMMTEAVRGRSPGDAARIADGLRAVVGAGGTVLPRAELGPLAALAGVRGFPSRVKCALLAWIALEAALGGEWTPGPAE